MSFGYLKVGDKVERDLGGLLMTLVVGDIDDEYVWCGSTDGFVIANREQGWMFDLKFGIETDHEAGWGVQYGKVLSWLLLPNGKPAFTPMYDA